MLDQADEFLQTREFLSALPLYDSLLKKFPDNNYLAYLLGTCYCYDAHKFTLAEINILRAKDFRQRLPDYDFFLGKAYYENDKFDLAIASFESYLKNPLSEELKKEVNHVITHCKNSKEQSLKGAVIKITNIGKPINTEGFEYSPVLPSNENMMVYTYSGSKSKGGKQSMPGKPSEKGQFFEDVYVTYKDSVGKWKVPQPIESINTTGHDAVMNISHDGQKIYIYRNISLGNGDIYVSKLSGSEWGKPELIKGINSKAWEGSVCLSPDESIIYFASERPGGLGGKDIWFAMKQADGSWGTPKNLGSSVNTKFDEDSPFIHQNGKTMFFSSTGHNSVGGYDIFRSDLKDGKWSAPFNLGKPINTTQDDKFYVVSPDGKRGYYSSEKSSGIGGHDIYVVEPGMFGKPTELVMLTGNVTLDNKPVAAKIQVKTKNYKTDYAGIFNSNSVSGKYLINLPSGYEYEITYSSDSTRISKYLSTALIDSFATLELDAELFTVVPKLNIVLDTLQMESEELNIKGLNYNDIVHQYGGSSFDSLTYLVQIGAYRIIENFNYSTLIGLPKVERKIYDDGMTRFTLGHFKTLSEADLLMKKARHNGIKDAFILAVYKNKRMSFNDLIAEKILRKP